MSIPVSVSFLSSLGAAGGGCRRELTLEMDLRSSDSREAEPTALATALAAAGGLAPGATAALRGVLVARMHAHALSSLAVQGRELHPPWTAPQGPVRGLPSGACARARRAARGAPPALLPPHLRAPVPPPPRRRRDGRRCCHRRCGRRCGRRHRQGGRGARQRPARQPRQLPEEECVWRAGARARRVCRARELLGPPRRPLFARRRQG
jgi:hypothetical protein